MINISIKSIKQIKPLLWIFIILILLSLVLIYLRFPIKNISVVSTSPSNSDINIPLFTEITFKLNQPLPSSESAFVTITPNQNGTVTYLDNRQTIVFSSNSFLQPNTTYQITLSSRSLKEHNLTFSTLLPKTNKGFAQLLNNPSTSPAPTQITEAQKQLDLLRTLPYKGDGFIIQYLPPSDIYAITIFDNDSKKATQNALNYFESFGIKDPYNNLALMFLGNGY